MKKKFIEKIDQLSTEMLAVLNIILPNVRNSDIYLGELLVISTIYHKKIPNVKGKLLMTSLHLLILFEFVTLQHSVKASGDPGYQHFKKIPRFHLRK